MSTEMLTAEGLLEPSKFSVDAGMIWRMMLRWHCQEVHSRS